MNRGPSVSIVIEWENVLLAGQARSAAMLAVLRDELCTLGRPTEVIFFFDSEQLEEAELRAFVAASLCPQSLPALTGLRLLPAAGAPYYDLKNAGAQAAAGEIVVFLDSDAVPEPGWLAEILRPFDDYPQAAVVAGHTYLEPSSLLARAFALGWFFPVRVSHRSVTDTARRFFANNVAFRRKILLDYPFPSQPPGSTRGACVLLAEELQANNIAIWQNTAARAHHPPPNGLRHFLIRALADGRDHSLRWQLKGGNALTRIARAPVYFLQRMRAVIRRLWHERAAVGLSRWEAPAALAIMVFYYLLAAMGSIAAVLFPRQVSNAWRI